MPNNTLIFLRHAKTLVDKKVSIKDWILTEDGEIASQKVADSGEFDDVDFLICSTEKKSFLTIEPIAKKLDKEVFRVDDLSEIWRGDASAITKEEYDEMKVKVFQDLDFTDNGWETCNNALKRFKEAIRRIDENFDGKKILISAHGTVMTLYFAYSQNKLDDLFSRWKSLGFCDYGIVENGKVVKDIA